jgi:UDP-glucose 4-epimerase
MSEIKKVLVTGGGGFIGSYVVERLIALGITPVIFDGLISPPKPPEAEFVSATVCDRWAVDFAVSKCDGVIHLAGILGTSETIRTPEYSIQVNITGSLNIFDCCDKHRKPCVYITVGNYWMDNPYSITKSAAERFAWMFNNYRGTEISVVRGLNAYGPRQKHSPVRKIIPNFIIPALKGEELLVYGDGSQIMDMIYVEDLADILVKALTVDHRRHCEHKASSVFQAGTGQPTSVDYLAKKIIKMVGSGSIKYVPMRPGEPPGSVVLADPTTLSPLFEGKRPTLVGLDEGLAKTIEYYRHYDL